MEVKFKGSAIYYPSGKAKEYSFWAANFYNGCSCDCDYCYMKKPPFASIWTKVPTIKKSLGNFKDALTIFSLELEKNIDEIRKSGLFFNFNSDLFCKESIELNRRAISICTKKGVPVKALTKLINFNIGWFNPDLVSIGFTLTGHDKKESGASTNKERLEKMAELKSLGFKTWASIEPVIDIYSSLVMVAESYNNCDHYKIGLLSGEKFNLQVLRNFINKINGLLEGYSTVYWKDELLSQAGIDRSSLPAHCVGRGEV